jgi:hypothetical protein
MSRVESKERVVILVVKERERPRLGRCFKQPIVSRRAAPVFPLSFLWWNRISKHEVVIHNCSIYRVYAFDGE